MNLTILRRFYGIICACANSVHQAVFSSPAKNGLGTRLGSGGLALSVYIRKLSFSPSISSHLDLFDMIVTILSKLRLVKKWVHFDYGKGIVHLLLG